MPLLRCEEADGKPHGGQVADPYVTSRDQICSGLDLAQTAESLCWRVILDNSGYYHANNKMPYYKLFGLDVSESCVRLFVRGDELNPVLFGRLSGRCVPEETLFELTKDEMASPCVKITLLKAKGHMRDWGEEPLDWSEDALDQLEGGSDSYVARFRDFMMEPSKGSFQSLEWTQFVSMLWFALPLPGIEWHDATSDEFDVQVDGKKFVVKCRDQKRRVFNTIRAELMHEVDAERSCIRIERDPQDRSGRGKVLRIEVAKAEAQQPWEKGPFNGGWITSEESTGPGLLFPWAPLAPASGCVEPFSWEKQGDWVADLKQSADVAFKSGDFKEAVVQYSYALRFAPASETLLSNRSAAYAKLNLFQLALHDACRAEETRPDWSKICFRKGQALRGLRQSQAAVEAFQRGKELDDVSSAGVWDSEISKTREALAVIRAKKGLWV